MAEIECPVDGCGYTTSKGRAFAIHWGKADETHPGDPPDEIDTSDPEMSKRMEGKSLSQSHRQAIAEAKVGENNPLYGRPRSQEVREKISEAKQGHDVNEETRAKISETLQGTDHPGQFEPTGEENVYDYGPLTQSDKDQIRDEANRMCQRCGKTREEQGYKMSVHHIDGDTYNNEPSNLKVLCHSCHRLEHE